MKVGVLCLFLQAFIYSLAIAQETVPQIYRLENWKSYHVPEDSLTLSQYVHAQDDWMVFKKDGIPYVMDYGDGLVEEKAPENDSVSKEVIDLIFKYELLKIENQHRYLPVEDGYLIALNGGELGKGLFWFSKDTKQHYRLSEEHVFSFIKSKGRIYVTQGATYGNPSYGSLMFISKDKYLNKWFAYTDHTLPYAPIGIDTNSRGNFVIATTNGLLEIAWNGRYITIMQDAFWDSPYVNLFPSSMIIVNDIVYMGMRHGVFRIDLNTKKQDWLMKD